MIWIDKDPKGIFVETSKIIGLQINYSDYQYRFNDKYRIELNNDKVYYLPIAKEIVLAPNVNVKSENKYLSMDDGDEISEQLRNIGKMVVELPEDKFTSDKIPVSEFTNSDSDKIDDEILRFTKRWGFIRFEKHWIREQYFGMPIYKFKEYAHYFQKIYDVWIDIYEPRQRDIDNLRRKIKYCETPGINRIQVLFDGFPIGHPIKESLSEEEIIKHVIKALSHETKYDDNVIEILKQTTDKETFKCIMKYQSQDDSIDNYSANEIKELKKRIKTRPYIIKGKNEILFNGDHIKYYGEPKPIVTDNDVIEIAQVWLMNKINPVIRVQYELLPFKNSFKPVVRPEDVLTLAYFSLIHEMTGEGIRPKYCYRKSCGAKFIPRRNNRLYCSDRCKIGHKNRLNYERRKERSAKD